MFKNKVLLITGGTGSFGNAVVNKFMETDIAEIRIFSRDEKKQDDMRKKYSSNLLKFYIGDVRDFQSVLSAVRGSDFIFHSAALKQVPSCEFHPLEAVKTNIIGTENVLEAAILSKVKKVICLSTDKAVYPINAMGISKAMMEKVVISKSRSSEKTIICATRYGNVMCSRGSVIPLFASQIMEDKPITITNPSMTRFIMTLEDAVKLVLFAFKKGNSGDIFVQKSPAATIDTLSKSLIEIFEKPNHKIINIGNRHGEKIHEVLLSREEIITAEDLGDYYRIPPDLREMNHDKYIDEGDPKLSNTIEYSSKNTSQLDIKSLKKLLLKVNFINKLLEVKNNIKTIK